MIIARNGFHALNKLDDTMFGMHCVKYTVTNDGWYLYTIYAGSDEEAARIFYNRRE